MTVRTVPYLPMRPDSCAPITQAAIRVGGVMYISWRHKYIIRALIMAVDVQALPQEQGFMDLEGRFLSRTEAATRVKAIKQAVLYSDVLVSENLWDDDGIPWKHGTPPDDYWKKLA